MHVFILVAQPFFFSGEMACVHFLPCHRGYQGATDHGDLPPSGSTPDDFLSSTSIFDHVDRLSRGSSDGLRRQGNKVQLIAMQPQPSPPHAAPQASPSLTEKVMAWPGGRGLARGGAARLTALPL